MVLKPRLLSGIGTQQRSSFPQERNLWQQLSLAPGLDRRPAGTALPHHHRLLNVPGSKKQTHTHTEKVDKAQK